MFYGVILLQTICTNSLLLNAFSQDSHIHKQLYVYANEDKGRDKEGQESSTHSRNFIIVDYLKVFVRVPNKVDVFR